MDYPKIQIGAFATPVFRIVPVVPGTKYRLLGVKWWGEGPYERNTVDGSEIRAKTLAIVRSGDLIINKIWVRHGSSGIIPFEMEGCAATGEFPTFELDESKVDKRWLLFLFKTKWFWEQCNLRSQGTSGKNRIKPNEYLKIQIPLPSLDEQQRIVGRIEGLAGKVEEARRLRETAVAESSSLLTSIISNLEFDDSCWTNIGTVLAEENKSVRSGPFGSQLTHAEFVDSGVMAIGTRDVLTNRFERNSGWYITHEKFEQFTRYQVFPGDLLVTIVGASIGRFCIVPGDIPLAFTTKHVVAVTFDTNLVYPIFASYLLNYHWRCRDNIFSQTAGSAQPSLNNTKVKAIEIPIPSIDEQLKVVERLVAIQDHIEALQHCQSKTHDELNALLPSILDKAFKGEL